LETTSFKKLKKKENKEGFSEAIFSKKKNEKIPFFNMGFKSDWKKILKKSTVRKIEEKFGKEMMDLGYLR